MIIHLIYRVYTSTHQLKNLKKQKELHVRKGDAFYAQLADITKVAEQEPNKSLAVCFDYQKNLPLPLTNTGREYYMRQLWIHNFGVHNLATQEATMFLYGEHYGSKGPNEVISCLWDYFHQNMSEQTEAVHIFMDNCFAQCKNKYIMAFWQWLSTKLDVKIQLYFPIPGHSFMPIDRDFAMIEKCRRRQTKAVLPSVWINMIKTAQQNPPFRVVYVKYPLTDNMEPDETPIINVRDFKQSLDPYIQAPGIQMIRGVQFLPSSTPVYRNSMFENIHPGTLKLLKKNASLKDLDSAFLSADVLEDFLPISKPKFDNVQSLLQAVALPKSATFYTFLHHRQSSCSNSEEEEEN